MEKINIICVDDQRTVLTALMTDLEMFEEYFNLEECESAEEASSVLDEFDREGERIALIISDHVMPGTTGVDFLISVDQDHRYRSIKKILLTGLATHQDTIKAINKAHIDQYMEKPYQKDVLIQAVKKLVTEYLFENGIDYKRYVQILDQQVLLDKMRNSSI